MTCEKVPLNIAVMNTVTHPINRAIAAVGGAAELARRLSVTRQAVYLWVASPGRIPPRRAVEIEGATNGAVRREELRPDIFAP